MLKFHADLFCEIINTLGTIEALMSKTWGADSKHDELAESIRKHLSSVRNFCDSAGLDMAVKHIDRGIAGLLTPAINKQQLAPQIAELKWRIVDQLSSELVLRIPKEHAKHFLKPRDKWQEVIEVFCEIAIDVEEAGKCFACERYAAAVHHTVMIVERGLLTLGPKIGVNDPKSGWTAITNRLNVILKEHPSDRSEYVQRHFAALEQVHGTVEGLKNAWRNKISHAQGVLTLMTSDFTPEVAEEIIIATRAFMRRIATKLP